MGEATVRLVSSEISRPATSSVPTVAQVAAPKAESERTNWLVQALPAYSVKEPAALPRIKAEVKEETAKEVVVAAVPVARVKERLGKEETSRVEVAVKKLALTSPMTKVEEPTCKM